MVEIKCCPFCWSDRVELVKKLSRGADGKDKVSYYVKCHKCRARGPSYNGPSENVSRGDYAVYYWNVVRRDKEVQK